VTTSLEHRISELERRVSELEQLRTPEQMAQRNLIQKAEHVIGVARAEGQLEWEPPL